MTRRKINPVSKGDYAPLPFEAILSPDGKFYRAGPWRHEQTAEEVTGEKWDTLVRRGWLRVSAGLIHLAFSYANEPTQAQWDAVQDYAAHMAWSIDEAFDPAARPQVRRALGLEARRVNTSTSQHEREHHDLVKDVFRNSGWIK